MTSPCYDEKTKTDCPRRHAGCAVDCPKWADYIKERDEMYERRGNQMNARSSADSVAYRRMALKMKYVNNAKRR